MLDEYRLQTMTIGEYIESVENKKIKVDQAVQRAFCWSNEMINNLIYSTLSKKKIYIPNIILAEENNENGTVKTYVVDGGQRTEALRQFLYDGYKISKSIRNRYVEYQAIVRDESGEIVCDKNGDPIEELIVFDLVGKTYNDLPEELKKRINNFNIAVAIYQDCTPEETCEHVMLYNSTKSMNASQKSLTYVGTYAEKIKGIKNNKFLINGTMLNETDKKNGEWERSITECIMAMFYIDDWKSTPKAICTYLNENAKESDFDVLNDYFTRLIPYSDKLDHLEVTKLFIKKDLMVWMAFVKKMIENGVSNEEIGKFLMSFNELKEKKVNGTTWIVLDEDKHPKDKKVIIEKINYLTTLALSFLHRSTEIEEENNTYRDTDEVETEIDYSEDDKLEPLDFIRKYANTEATEEDLDNYYDSIEYCVKKHLISKDHQLLNEVNELSLLALFAYTEKHNRESFIDFWLRKYAITHKTVMAKSQRDNYLEMVNSLERLVSMKRGATA